MSIKDPLLFEATVAVILMTPGPTNTLLATSGAVAGIYRSMPLLIAELAGYSTSLAVVGFLLGDWIARSAAFTSALRVSAGAYLLVLAVRTWRARQDTWLTEVSFSRVLVASLLNPKALIFALVVIPTRDAQVALYLAGFSSTLLIIGGVWITLGNMVGRAAGSRHFPLIPKTASVALACFSVILLISTLMH